MAVTIDGRVLLGKERPTKFYGNKQLNNTKSGFIKQENPKDLAQLVIKAFIQSPQYLQTYADEAAAAAANVKSGTIYKTAAGAIRVKL